MWFSHLYAYSKWCFSQIDICLRSTPRDLTLQRYLILVIMWQVWLKQNAHFRLDVKYPSFFLFRWWELLGAGLLAAWLNNCKRFLQCLVKVAATRSTRMWLSEACRESPAWMFGWKLLLLLAKCQSPVGSWTMLLPLLMWLWHLQQPQLQQHCFLKRGGVVNQLLYRYDLSPQQDRSGFFRTSLPPRRSYTDAWATETWHPPQLICRSLIITCFASERDFC